MTAYIYKITNISNNKSYVGYTTDYTKRIHDHFLHNRSNPKYLLGKAIKKYGKKSFSFELIYENEDHEHTLNVMEPMYIAIYNTFCSNGSGYNMTYGGDKVIHTEETKKKIGEAAKARLKIKNNGAEAAKKNYKVFYKDGTEELVTGFHQFCRERGYTPTTLKLLMLDKRKYHKNIIKMEKVD